MLFIEKFSATTIKSRCFYFTMGEHNIKFSIFQHTQKLFIQDTAGQEKFNALTPMYYRDALGAVIVYDITFKQSFERVRIKKI